MAGDFELDELVLEAFAEAVRMGFPVYSFRAVPGRIVVVTGSGRAVYTVRELTDPISGAASIAVSLGMDYGAVVLAEPHGDGWRLYPERVPDAVALEPILMSRFEADAWGRRISLLINGSYEPLDIGVGGFKAALLETGWEAAVVHEPSGLVLVWLNCLTGSKLIPLEWQVKMGLVRGDFKELERLAEELASKAIEAGVCSRAEGLRLQTD